MERNFKVGLTSPGAAGLDAKKAQVQPAPGGAPSSQQSSAVQNVVASPLNAVKFKAAVKSTPSPFLKALLPVASSRSSPAVDDHKASAASGRLADKVLVTADAGIPWRLRELSIDDLPAGYPQAQGVFEGAEHLREPWASIRTRPFRHIHVASRIHILFGDDKGGGHLHPWKWPRHFSQERIRHVLAARERRMLAGDGGKSLFPGDLDGNALLGHIDRLVREGYPDALEPQDDKKAAKAKRYFTLLGDIATPQGLAIRVKIVFDTNQSLKPGDRYFDPGRIGVVSAYPFDSPAVHLQAFRDKWLADGNLRMPGAGLEAFDVLMKRRALEAAYNQLVDHVVACGRRGGAHGGIAEAAAYRLHYIGCLLGVVCPEKATVPLAAGEGQDADES